MSTSDVVAQCLLISISSPPRFPQLKLSPHSCLLFPSLIIVSSSVAPSCDQISCHVTGAMLSHLQRDRPLHPTPHFPTFPPFNKCYTKMAIYKNTKRNGICPLVLLIQFRRASLRHVIQKVRESEGAGSHRRGEGMWRNSKYVLANSLGEKNECSTIIDTIYVSSKFIVCLSTGDRSAHALSSLPFLSFCIQSKPSVCTSLTFKESWYF